MSSKGRNLRLNVIKDKPNIIMKDLPRLNYVSDCSFDTELDKYELETFSDPNFTTGSCSSSDTEVFNYETERAASLTSCKSDEEERARKGKEVSVDLSFESDCSNYSLASSNVTLDSNDNFFIENNSPGSSSSENLEQVCPDVPEEISKGFNRLKELVSELLAVDGTKTKIEENGQFVQGLLKQLSLHSESNTIEKVEVETNEKTKNLVNKKDVLKDVWIAKCAADVNTSSESSLFAYDKLGGLKRNNNDIKDENFVEVSDPKVVVKLTPLQIPDIIRSHDVQFINEIPATAPINFLAFSPNLRCDAVDISCSTSPHINSPLPSTTVIPLANSPDIPTSSPVDASFDTSSDKLEPFFSSTTTTGSVVLPTLGTSSIALTVPEVVRSTVPVSNNPKTCEKSRYEMIREDIIAERNEQLKAMGFFEEFSVLKSEMIPKKPPKAKKKASEFKGKKEVRRSERLFLSSPELDQTYSKCKPDATAVKNIIEEILTSVRQDTINSESGSCQVSCEECGKGFNKRRYMMEHVRKIHRNKIILRCQMCDYMTFRSSRLQTHMKLHVASDTQHKVYSCDLCDCVVKFRNNLIKHRYNVHKLGNKPVKRSAHSCEQCDFVTKNQRNLIKHKSIVHRVVSKGIDGKVFGCDKCSYVTKQLGLLWRHKCQSHKPDNLTDRVLFNDTNLDVKSCDQCNFVTTREKYLRKHKRNIHNQANLIDKGEVSKENSTQLSSFKVECPDVTVAIMANVESDTDSIEIFTDDSDDEETHVTPVKKRGTCVSEIEEKVMRVEKIWSCETCGNDYANKDSLNVHKKKSHNLS